MRRWINAPIGISRDSEYCCRNGDGSGCRLAFVTTAGFTTLSLTRDGECMVFAVLLTWSSRRMVCNGESRYFHSRQPASGTSSSTHPPSFDKSSTRTILASTEFLETMVTNCAKRYVEANEGWQYNPLAASSIMRLDTLTSERSVGWSRYENISPRISEGSDANVGCS